MIYDLIIIGAGPAGLTASIYASCYHLSHLVIGKDVGGQMLFAPDILNYPGFVNISGKELTNQMVAQVKARGGELVMQSVTRISNMTGPAARVSPFESRKNGTVEIGNPSLASPVIYEVETIDGKKYQAKSIILATGTERRKLNIPGEVEYTAKGVHYCATCEKFDYEGKVCAVVGGANSAVQAAVELAQAASKVYVIYRGSTLRGDPIWLSQIESNNKIEVMYGTAVSQIEGNSKIVTGIKINKTSNSVTPIKDTLLSVDKVFVEIGGVPGTALVIPLGVQMDTGGYIKVDDHLATSVPGIYAAGDMVSYGLSIEQISSAIGLGARAASSVFAYLKNEKAPLAWGKSQIKR